MMEQYAFPAYHCHQSEHEQALQGLESHYQQWLEDLDIEKIADYVQNIWPAWYVQHISTMDVVTSAFIKQAMDASQVL